jgi:polyhydroxybutyrate depolymerase
MHSLLLFAFACQLPGSTGRASVPQRAAVESVVTCAVQSGRSEIALEVDGLARKALVWRGPEATDKAPLIFVWHGFGSSAGRMMTIVAPDVHWKDAIVVSAEGLGRTFDKFGDRARPGWQVSAGELGDRDLHLFDALLTRLEPCVDTQKVFSTGFSNGGFFTNLLGCKRGEQLLAIAPVGGGGPMGGGCGPAMPAHVTHGRSDDIVSYGLGLVAAQYWAIHNGCGELAAPATAGCVAVACDDPVEFCTFEGKHSWPSNTSADIARFFRAAD